MTKYLKETEIAAGARIIKNGGIVAFRTETVYGLGANATDEAAVKKVFAAKGRPSANPLIVHFANINDISDFFASCDQTIDKSSLRILKHFKSALTVILPKPNGIPAIVSGGLDSVAVRVPSCKFARTFIKACGVPLAAPSANISSRPSPTSWTAVKEDLDGKIDAVFMGPATKIGVESSVVKVIDDKILVLRLGGTDTKKLAAETGMRIEVVTDSKTTEASPGTRFKHYSPNCDFIVLKSELINANVEKQIKKGKMVAVLCIDENMELYKNLNNCLSVIGLGKTSTVVTKNFFAALRRAEKTNNIIICEEFPSTPEFEAVRERAIRASLA